MCLRNVTARCRLSNLNDFYWLDFFNTGCFEYSINLGSSKLLLRLVLLENFNSHSKGHLKYILLCLNMTRQIQGYYTSCYSRLHHRGINKIIKTKPLLLNDNGALRW